jgi:hypothetical protein
MLRTRALLVVGLLLGWTSTTSAQDFGSRQVALDTVIGVQDVFQETRDWPTQIVLDTFMSVQIRSGLQMSFRPVVWRVGGTWETLIDQVSLQYEFHKGSNWRIEAGRFPSPMGLGMTENRASINAGVLWCHRPYYMPLPSLGPDAPRVSLASAVYPNGLQVATSSNHWDLRAAVVDQAPLRFWHDDLEDRHANVIVGGGVSPRQGLRLGVAAAAGTIDGSTATPYRMINVEAQYAFDYTRISGEWTRDRFDLPGRGSHVSEGVTMQVQQTLTPRVFVHARASIAESPAHVRLDEMSMESFRSIDTTVGYRVDPDVTLRVGYNAVSGFGAPSVDHQLAFSLMWVKRWW